MRSRSTPFVTHAAMLCIAALTATAPAHAQFTHVGNAYYNTADYTLNTDISSNEVFVGKNTAFTTLPGTITLSVVTGAKITNNGTTVGGVTYLGLNVFGNHRTNITGGVIFGANGYDTSTVNISGGEVFVAAGYNTSTVNISGGSGDFVYGIDNSTVNISGGNGFRAIGTGSSTVNITGGNLSAVRSGGNSIVNISGGNHNQTDCINSGTFNISGGTISSFIGYDTSMTNISGGTITNGLALFKPTATVNFVGTDLSYAYTGYGNANPYGLYADAFQISGIFGGAARTYDLYILNQDETTGGATTPNSAARQFTFNGVTPVTVPESSTLALVLPALIVGFGIVRRKHRVLVG